ncbi:hypothetical protein UI24_04110 [Mycobacteroides franklinii]|nr:hypothetical protein [Mycobacteroides franklinii]
MGFNNLETDRFIRIRPYRNQTYFRKIVDDCVRNGRKSVKLETRQPFLKLRSDPVNHIATFYRLTSDTRKLPNITDYSKRLG